MTPAAKLTLGSLRDRYLETHGNGSLEERTLDGIRLHFKHLVAALGEAFPIRELSLADLQGYVDRRAKAKGIGAGTLPGHDQEGDRHASHGLELGREDGSRRGPVPQRRAALSQERREAAVPDREPRSSGSSPASTAEAGPTSGTRSTSARPRSRSCSPTSATCRPSVDPPLMATAAHTGARRSELIRMRVIRRRLRRRHHHIREKKRSHSERTTRRVPLSSSLAAVLKEWIAVHPGGPWLFCQSGEVERSRKRSARPATSRVTGGPRRSAQD